MRVLCDVKELVGWKPVFESIGDQFVFWNPDTKPAFDMFKEYQPEFVITSSKYNRALYKNIDKNRTIVLGRADANEQEREAFKDFFTFTFEQNNIWEGSHVIPGSADIFMYLGGKEKKCFRSFYSLFDYRNEEAERFVYPIIFLKSKGLHAIKIYGNTYWDIPQYLGVVDSQDKKDIISSSFIMLDINNPDPNYIYNIACAKGFCLSTKEHSLVTTMTTKDKSSQQIIDMLSDPYQHKKNMEKNQKIVLQSETCFDRICNIFGLLEMKNKQEMIIESKQKCLLSLLTRV
jgi:hypothetical protein